MSTCKLTKHLEQSSLKVAGTHARISEAQVCEPLHLMEQFGLRIDVGADVLIKRIVKFLVTEFLFHRSAREHFEQTFKSKAISVDAEAYDDAVGDRRDERMVAELFSRVNI